jgi:mycoredoxin
MIKLYCTRFCSDCQKARALFDAHNIRYEMIDINKDESGKKYVMGVNNGNCSVPTILFEDGTLLVEPSIAELLTKIQET